MRLGILASTFGLLCTPLSAFAADASFSDVPSNNPYFPAIEYLKDAGVLSGYADGTFKPNQTVNRAEAIKIIVSEKGSVSAPSEPAESPTYADVPLSAWYYPYIEEAYRTMRIIDGPPVTRSFVPQKPVTKAEFLKMLLLAYNIDAKGSYAELTYPLGTDANDPTGWYYPYVRYAVSASMIKAEGGTIQPSKELTRGEIADILYSFLLYKEGKRTQTLLSVSEQEVLSALRYVQSNEEAQARASAARAILSARGALASRPNDNTVKSAVKLSEAAMLLTDAKKALLEEDKQTVLSKTSDSWHLGQKAKEFSSALNSIVDQLQKAAAEMAEGVR